MKKNALRLVAPFLAAFLALQSPAQAVAMYGGPASSTSNGYVTTGTQTFAGAKTFSGTVTLGTVSISAFTLSGTLTVAKTSEASAAEVMGLLTITDDATGKLELANATATNAVLLPQVKGTATGANIALTLTGACTADTGAGAAVSIVGQTAAAGTISTRPILAVKSYTTVRALIGADGGASFGLATQTAIIKMGTGSPESAVTAGVGSLWLRTDGGANTTLYIKESGTGNTGWVAK